MFNADTHIVGEGLRKRGIASRRAQRLFMCVQICTNRASWRDTRRSKKKRNDKPRDGTVRHMKYEADSFFHGIDYRSR